MTELARKKSPRAPTIALDEAIERVARVYDKEKRHPANADLVAKHLGYSGARNGSAMAVIASLRYYGLLLRPKEGFLCVSKDYESYKFAPNEQLRREILLRWLVAAPVFSDLLEQYADGLPSDANITYDLIHRGFNPTTAETVTTIFRRSVDYARYFEQSNQFNETAAALSTAEEPLGDLGAESDIGPMVSSSPTTRGMQSQVNDQVDRIPVRLTKGRKAWLEIPAPFYKADKNQLIAQINLLLTDDDDEL